MDSQQKQGQKSAIKKGAIVTKTAKPKPQQQYQLTISDLSVNVIRKNIKNLHIRVYPPDGRIQVAVPLRVSDDALQLVVISKLNWIKQQQAKFAAQERQTVPQYMSGESHYFLGTRYLLNVIYQEESRPHVHLTNNNLNLVVRPDSDSAQREQLLINWYRQQLKEVIVPPLIANWQNTTNLQIAEWQIKKMKTRWGSCNVRAKRIWLNLELVKKPVHCIEYVIVHELVHLLVPHHNADFYSYMTKFLPKWQIYRQELNAVPII